jgi:hypothetical protein
MEYLTLLVSMSFVRRAALPEQLFPPGTVRPITLTLRRSGPLSLFGDHIHIRLMALLHHLAEDR